MSGIDIRRKVARLNRWRDQYNPLRALTVTKAVSMFEGAQRGEYADLQWTYRFIERRDADLIALVERRGGALLQMDWNIKMVDEQAAKRRGIKLDAKLAEEQAAALRAAYERIENLYEAVEHLALAVFREYAIAQFQKGDKAALPGEADRIECLNPWNIMRDGMFGDWYWNPDALQMSATMESFDKIDPAFCLIREWPRPLDEIALLKFIRANMSQKDWDSFIEIFGIPGWIVIMPPNVAGKEAEYKAAAEDVAEGQSGALPNGSDVKCADQPRGVNPFRDYMAYLTEKLVLAGTGGMLTMLTAPGSGTLAGGAHMEAFDIIARGEARKIGEIFQRQFDRVVLGAAFPDRQRLAYFELAANEEQDVGEILDHAVKITQAGGKVDWAQFSEKTGYTVAEGPAPAAQIPGAPAAPAAGLLNRAAPEPAEAAREQLVASSVEQEQAVRADVLTPWLARLEELAGQADLSEAEFLKQFEDLVRDLPAEALTPANISRISAVREGALGAAVVNALSALTPESRNQIQES
jgi:phage gp29-like protein